MDESVVEIQPDLPAADFGGYTFTFLAPNRAGDQDWVSPTPLELVAEEEIAEPVNDTVYRRNMTIFLFIRYKTRARTLSTGSGFLIYNIYYIYSFSKSAEKYHFI